MAKTFSGRQIINILCRHFDFYFVSQKGSHVKLRRCLGDKIITTVIPLHKELAFGTLKGILELGQVNERDFWNAV
ncbi:MAG: type II toxin-antitoxin system HicA family toxin [Parcubacteria group bacterium]|nr:type II toxin-antitoxin system HicA family toxin [Parcubacteria group bacterium]